MGGSQLPRWRGSYSVLTAVVVLAATFAVAEPAAADLGPLEDRMLQVVNAGRANGGHNTRGLGHGLSAHSGLRSQARQQAQRMLAQERLHHDGLGSRVNASTPDPAESNGAPDDGFGAYCEVVGARGTTTNESDEQIVQAMYEAFRTSPAHRACMFDEPSHGHYTVAGVGFADEVDAGKRKVWVSIMIVRDRSMPGTAPQQQPPPPPQEAPPPPAPAPPAEAPPSQAPATQAPPPASESAAPSASPPPSAAWSPPVEPVVVVLPSVAAMARSVVLAPAHWIGPSPVEFALA